MATREKKLSVNRKQPTPTPSPTATTTATTEEEETSNNNEMNSPINEVEVTTEEISTEDATDENSSAVVYTDDVQQTTPRKFISKNPKRIRRKKATTTATKLKKAPPKIIKTTLTKAGEPKKKRKRLLKNCAKQQPQQQQIRPKRTKTLKNCTIDGDCCKEESPPPILEPILPIQENINNDDGDNNIKTTPRKKAKRPPKIDNYAKKTNDSDTTLRVDQNKTKRVYRRKPKLNPVAITATAITPPPPPPTTTQNNELEVDTLMDELAVLVGNNIKEEPESNKSKILKRKRNSKEDNFEITLNNMSPSQHKVIDTLDLNVNKRIKRRISMKRRHSIEKISITTIEQPQQQQENQSIATTPTTVNSSPKCKTTPKTRQTPTSSTSSITSSSLRRSNPYKTRSDSPARILRNGKHRKLKDLELLDGLDVIKRRRRNYSEFSGSESVSKCSGYDSDSSFSDLSSLHSGVVENVENKDDIKIECKKEDQQQIIKSDDIGIDESNVIKEENVVDDAITPSPTTIIESPSLKVPEKSIILDIMKQTFNDTFDDSEKDKKIDENLVENRLFCDVDCKKEDDIQPKNNNNIKEEEEEETYNNEKMETNHIGTVEQVIEDVINNCREESPSLDYRDHHQQNEDNNSGSGERLDETPENLAIKENILQALGLQSLKAAKEAKLKNKDRIDNSNKIDNNYTGTLKTVIKLKKKGRNSFKMATLQKNKTKNANELDNCIEVNTKDGSSSNWKQHHGGGQSSDTAGAHRKSHYSNRSNMDGSSEHTSDGEVGANSQDGTTKALVIPEKASSFSIHPGRLCKDECSYCFGKFGLFDTPCHIAQMKSIERQNKVLAAEKHLTRDSCLCDACYRHVDRKSNTPSYINRSYKRSTLVAPGPRQDHCHVLGCSKIASNILRRKWIIKMRKSICEVINLDLDNPGLHSIPICDEHYSMLEHLMVCAMCKRRLAKNHIHYLGPDVIVDLNQTLQNEGIPLCLSDKPVVCKLCKYFAAIIMKPIDERPENSSTFFNEYKKRLLHFNDIVPMDEAAAEEPITVPTKDKSLEKEHLKKKKKLSKNQQISDNNLEQQPVVPSSDSTNQSRPESPSDYMVDYNTLIPSIAMDCGSDNESRKDVPIYTSTNNNNNNNNSNKSRKVARPESVKQAVEISKNIKFKNDKNSEIVAVQRLGSNPSISVRQLFPCEEDLPLQGHIDFNNIKERTPEGWEKCTSIIQYDMEMKHLWQELQKPYGNQSSFLRHLILLEKYFRNGDLILAPNASHHSINYTESVNSRLRAYDNIPTNAGNVQPISMLPFNRPISKSGLNSINKEVQQSQQQLPQLTSSSSSSSSLTTTTSQSVSLINAANIPKNTPLTLSQLNSSLVQSNTASNKSKPIGSPPGLISLQPGTNKPITSLIKLPQSQKIKFPITKNWRPNLIPIDPNKKTPERRAGLVQVISGGKPYHITLEDYKKMCAIKKSFEMKQKRLQESSNNNNNNNSKSNNSVLKSIGPRKGLVISKSSTIHTNTTTTTIIPTLITPTTTTSTAANTTIISTADNENILEKLDKQVERLDVKFNENRPIVVTTTITTTTATAPLTLLPKIPKSLTVIPQTVTRKPSRPSSPVLMITQKPKQQSSIVNS